MRLPLQKQLEEMELEDPLAGSGLEPQDVHGSSRLEEEDEPEAAPDMDWSAILNPAATVAETVPAMAPRPRVPLPQLDAEALRKARAADKRERARAQISAGLDMVAFRRPFEARETGRPNEEALLKDFGRQRQGALDERAADSAEFNREVALKKLAQPKGRTALQDLLTEEQIKKLRSERTSREQKGELSVEDRAREAEELQGLRDFTRKTLGPIVDKMGREELMRFMSDETRKALAKERAATGAKAKADKADAKADEKQKAYFLEGFELRPDASPRLTEVEAARSAQASTNTIAQTVGEIRKLYKLHGTEVLPGPARARMEGLVTDLQLAMKGPEQYQLGVLAGPDMGLLEKTVANPTGTNASMLDFFSGDANVLSRYDVLGEQVQRRFANKARSLGYVPKGGDTQRTPVSSVDLTASPQGGLSPEKKSRLEALRRKKTEGTLR